MSRNVPDSPGIAGRCGRQKVSRSSPVELVSWPADGSVTGYTTERGDVSSFHSVIAGVVTKYAARLVGTVTTPVAVRKLTAYVSPGWIWGVAALGGTHMA